MAINETIKKSWIELQKKYDYPVNAIGLKIADRDAQTLRVWRDEGRPQSQPLTLLAQVLPPFGLIVGIYLFWKGADEPGGTFAGGTMLAAMWVLVLAAGLAKAPPVTRRWLRLAIVIGPLFFLSIAFAGFALADGFLAYPHGFAKPLIVAIETVLTLSIAATLAMMIAGRPQERATP